VEGTLTSRGDLFVGTWTADVQRSQLDPNRRFKAATLTVTRDGRNYRLAAQGTGPDGQTVCEVHAIKFGTHTAADGLTVTAIQPEPNRIEVQATQHNLPVGDARYTVSADGRTMIAATAGTDAQGRLFRTVIVFNRES
jgi:hypothetical protein